MDATDGARRAHPANFVMRLTALDWEMIEELRRRINPTAKTAHVVRHALWALHRQMTTGTPLLESAAPTGDG